MILPPAPWTSSTIRRSPGTRESSWAPIWVGSSRPSSRTKKGSVVRRPTDQRCSPSAENLAKKLDSYRSWRAPDGRPFELRIGRLAEYGYDLAEIQDILAAAGLDIEPDARLREEATRLGTDPEGLVEVLNGGAG